MERFGLSANLMSLGGLAIAIGMLVDAAVVVVENVVTQLAPRAHGGGATRRIPRLHLIYRATREVAVPVASGILIIVIVFLPLLTLEGLEGKLFVPVALTIVFALLSSLVLSLTAIPVLASFLLGRVSHGEPPLVRWAARLYMPALGWGLRHPWPVIGLALVLLVASGFLYTRIGKAFMPTLDEGDLIVQLEKLPSISLAESLAMDGRVQQAILAEIPEVQAIVARTGSDELGLDPMGLNQTDSFLVLKPQEQWTLATKDELIERLRDILERFPGLGYVFTQPIEMRVSEMMTGVRGDLAVKIFGSDQDQLNRTALEIVGVIEGITGAEDVYTPRNEGAQYLNLVVDRMAAGRLGIDGDSLAVLLRAQIEGMPIGTLFQEGKRRPLVVRGPEDLRTSPSRFSGLRVALPDGRSVPLTNLVRIERIEGPVALSRERGNRMAVAIANVNGRDLVGFVEEAKARVADQVDLPTGYRLQWGGQFENQQRASRRLALVVPVALGLIFLVLFSTFGSIKQALLVLSNVPFALIGGVFGLAITGEYLSVPASVGFIALWGIAVLNGVVLVSYIRSLREGGMSVKEAVLEGARQRFRPVMMTATVAMLGLIPFLISDGPGSEVQRPLAIVVIGGLITCTLLTLVVVPTIYHWFDEKDPEA
jgi:cobalt-zinc-cadmium resistance protein CzcA